VAVSGGAGFGAPRLSGPGPHRHRPPQPILWRRWRRPMVVRRPSRNHTSC